MNKNLFGLMASAALLVSTTGCFRGVDGRSRAGIPFAKDTIESRYERPVQQIFDAAKQVLSFNGTLTGENTITKMIEAKVDTRTVWVRVDEVETKVSRVVVQARNKSGGSDIDLASEIDKQIALHLK